MSVRVTHYHLILDRDHGLREALVAFPGRLATPVSVKQLPLVDPDAFLAKASTLDDNAHLRHTDGILYRLTRFHTDIGYALVAAASYPPQSWEHLRGSAPIMDIARDLLPRRGLVLFMGDMGQGKTSVAATYLSNFLRARGGTAFAWQDPIETDLEGWHGQGYCHQIGITKDGYEKAAIDALRTRAACLYFGEAREPPACLAVMNTANAGPQTITTCHGYTLINGLLNFAAKAHTLDTQSYNLLAASLTAIFHLTLKDIPGHGPTLSVESLVVPEGPHAIRTQIRGQNIEGLVSHVRVQSNSATLPLPGAARR